MTHLETLEAIAQEMKDNPSIAITMSADADPRKYKEFLEHECPFNRKDNPVTGAIGGAMTYQFTPTELGTVVHISCTCGRTENITDYRMW